ncbi:MAG: Mg-dependent DNase, partial [Alistipes sp.]|nr:Mg-dependent DNase [Alistipes sp.]
PKTLEALRLMPLDRLFVETDESEVGIENVYERVAKARGVELEELKYKLEENYKKIFDIK